MKTLLIVITIWLSWLIGITRQEVRELRTDVQEALMPLEFAR